MGRPIPISANVIFIADVADCDVKIVANCVSECAATEDCGNSQAEPLETFHQVYYVETSSSSCYMPFQTCNSSLLLLH